METTDIENAVIELLKTENISYSVAAAGENITRDGWQCDGWKFTFAKAGKSESFDYYTGLGHRKANKVALLRPEAKFPKNTIGYASWAKKNIKPVTPHVAGILHSLIMESDAINMCFIDWCDIFGCDSDSIKVLGMYNACCDNAKRLKNILSHATCEKLSELLQDY